MTNANKGANWVEKPAGYPGTGKSALYAEALRLYLASADAPDMVSIAAQVGLRPDTLIQLAERQAWPKRRALVVRDASATRMEAVARIDTTLIREAEATIQTLTAAYRQAIGKAAALPDEPPDGAPVELRRKFLKDKLEILRLGGQGVREMVGIAGDLNLIPSAKKADDDSGGLDLSKLTQLNVVLMQAVGRMEHSVSPLPLVDEPDDCI